MTHEIIPVEQVARRILYFRGEKVLLDFDLAVLYGVGVKVLNQVTASGFRMISCFNLPARRRSCCGRNF